MRNPLGWLNGRNDHELARTHYAGRESATDLAARKKRVMKTVRRQVDIRDAARAGQAWEDRR